MALLPIYTYDARILREKTRDVRMPGPDTIRLVMDMLETMRAANGIGLAANQVGSDSSIFVVDISGTDGEEHPKPYIFINPRITDRWGDDIAFEEGCLSVPNVRDEIVRPELVSIAYRDLNFEEHELEADGLLARVIQHEYDHLQGVFFTDYIKGVRRRLIMPALGKIRRGEMEADYSLVPVAEQHLVD